jgi:hypothetical protein
MRPKVGGKQSSKRGLEPQCGDNRLDSAECGKCVVTAILPLASLVARPPTSLMLCAALR